MPTDGTAANRPVRTELRVDGANCPTCLNNTADVLRAIPGVRSVEMSTTGGCLAVEHAGVDESVLADAIRTNLHGTATYGAEVVMVSIDPLVVDLHCCHGAHH